MRLRACHSEPVHDNEIVLPDYDMTYLCYLPFNEKTTVCEVTLGWGR